MTLERATQLVAKGIDLPESMINDCIGTILSGRATDDAMYNFLTALAKKGETIEELVGAARAMRNAMIPISSHQTTILDTCGTGGDGTKTFNISTAAAIVSAAAGVAVAKHGNRKITSSTGSADVLAELGVNLDAESNIVERCLNELGICFCFAPRFHPAMKHVAAVRRRIPFPTIFNRLGPLSNPAHATHQVLGVGDRLLQDKLASALQALGCQRAVVVRGEDGVDEVSLSSDTRVVEVTAAGINEHCWRVSDFGVQVQERAELFADSPQDSAQCIREVLSGERGAKRDVVLINTAAGLWTVGARPKLVECMELAANAIDSGAASRLLGRLASLTSAPTKEKLA